MFALLCFVQIPKFMTKFHKENISRHVPIPQNLKTWTVSRDMTEYICYLSEGFRNVKEHKPDEVANILKRDLSEKCNRVDRLLSPNISICHFNNITIDTMKNETFFLGETVVEDISWNGSVLIQKWKGDLNYTVDIIYTCDVVQDKFGAVDFVTSKDENHYIIQFSVKSVCHCPNTLHDKFKVTHCLNQTLYDMLLEKTIE